MILLCLYVFNDQQILGSIFLPLMLPYKLSSYKASSNPVLASLLRIQLLYMGVGSLKASTALK